MTRRLDDDIVRVCDRITAEINRGVRRHPNEEQRNTSNNNNRRNSFAGNSNNLHHSNNSNASLRTSARLRGVYPEQFSHDSNTITRH